MKKPVLAVYERESTLWKNANAFYRAQDWVRMECFVADYEEDRKAFGSMGAKVVDSDGNDITGDFLADRFVVRLVNKSGSGHKDHEFLSRGSANSFVKKVLSDRVLSGWKRVH